MALEVTVGGGEMGLVPDPGGLCRSMGGLGWLREPRKGSVLRVPHTSHELLTGSQTELRDRQIPREGSSQTLQVPGL